jgi:hypothetical protein
VIGARRSVPTLLAAATVVALALAAHAWASSQHHREIATAARLRAPSQVSPAAGARVQAVPPFSWQRVRGAVRYEFELSADQAFESVEATYQTPNTFASIARTLADGSYYWRVRAIDKRNGAGRWSGVRSLAKAWTDTPLLLGPADDQAVSYPRTPLVLRWAPVPGGFKYVLRIATDPALAHSALGDRRPDIETSGTALALPWALAPGRYYWAVTPLDAERHPGARSHVGVFRWTWPTATAPHVTDLNADPRVFDPQFSWDPIPGAAAYEVEVNPSEDFAVGSRVCCTDQVTGTSLSPPHLLPNNTYFWRVRALDVDGNAGDWNAGAPFSKTFDDVVPSIPALRVRDNLADAAPPTGLSGLPTTGAPVISWDPVPGASSYEVAVAPYDDPGFCNWTASSLRARAFRTAVTSWTPLGSTARRPVGNTFTSVANERPFLEGGRGYCVRVRARTDRDPTGAEIVSEWTQLGGVGHAAFAYAAPQPSCAPTAMPASAYRGPQHGVALPRTPLFTWAAVPGACGYFVVVARDPEFTKIADIGFTTEPAYAPRRAGSPTTYSDETTSYYWAVMPTASGNGDGLSTEPDQDSPQTFQKRSQPPALLAPAAGAAVTSQPAFRWTPAEGAREYRIQVDDDPTFGHPLADLVTDATAYTSTSALPADTALYWRVRGDDENKVGLTWSATGVFRRRLEVPQVGPNPVGGEGIPILDWTPVSAAVSYDMHVEQADGTKRDFNMRSTAFTPVSFYGTGVWHWQVRANYRSGTRVVSGGYSGLQPFARRIATPANMHARRANGGMLLQWDPALMARRYKVQIATNDSFSTIVEQVSTSNTNYAPRLMSLAYRSAPRLYWRVAVSDEGGHLGGWATARLRNQRLAHMRVRGSLRAGRRGRVRVRVTGAGGRPLAGAVVRASGAGVSSRPRRTNGRGTVVLRLQPLARGHVSLSAAKGGYFPARATVRVR